MKRLKKALSLSLTLALALAMAVPAFAISENTLTLEDVAFSVDPIGIVTIQFKGEVHSSTQTAYMFDQSASIRMKDGRVFRDCYQLLWNPVREGGYPEEYFALVGESEPGIDNDNYDGLWSFHFNENDDAYYYSPYMVSKSYVDSLIEKGYKVDIQPYTAGQPTTPGQPEQPTRPVTPDVPGSYTVKKGDTWSSICTNFYGDNGRRYALMKANKNVKLTEGTVITLPGKLGKAVLLPAPAAGEGEKLYTVKAGDTLGKIAAAEYGKTSEYKAIFERNSDRLKNINLIYEGQVIVLPAKK